MVTKAELRLIEAAAGIREKPNPDDADRAFMARQLVQVTLPHTDPGNVPAWSRTNGNLTLGIQPGWDVKKDKSIGFPYGTIPRLLLFWMTTEALRIGERRLELGPSLASFMRELGLDPTNGGAGAKRSDARRLRDQMERLFAARISFVETLTRGAATGERWLRMEVAPRGELWWDPKQPEQDSLFGSWIMLGEDFFNAIMAAPVPVDLRVLKALKRSPLALDLYAWATYKTFAANRKGDDETVPWDKLQQQLGGDYTRTRAFRAAVRAALRKIKALFPGLTIAEYLDDKGGGLMVSPGTPSVLPRPSRRKT